MKETDIVRLRHMLVHVYFEIDEDILWDTIIYDIPKLIKDLGKIPDL